MRYGIEEAVRLDPAFAQAHNMLAMSLFPKFQFERSSQEVQLAYEQSGKLPEREKAWLLSNYYSVVEDAAQAVYWANRNWQYHPDDPHCFHTLARVLCRTGDAEHSIEHNRRLLDVTPDDQLGRKELIDDLCLAGDFEHALSEYQIALNRGVKDRRVHRAGAMAYLGLERYSEARETFNQTPESRDRTLDLQRVRVMEGDFNEAVSSLNELMAGARRTAEDPNPDAPSPIEMHQWNEFLCGSQFLAGRLEEANQTLERMADLAPYPPMARRLDCSAFWAYRLGNGPVLAKIHDRLAEIRRGWDNDFTRTVERHAMALLSWRTQSMGLAEQQFLDASDRAFGLWRLFDAEFYTAIGRPQRSLDFWENWLRHRGTVVELWFPGVFGLEWLIRSVTLQALGRSGRQHCGRTRPGIGRSGL